MREEGPRFLNLRIVSHNKAGSTLEEIQNTNHANSAYQFQYEVEKRTQNLEPKTCESPNVSNGIKYK